MRSLVIGWVFVLAFGLAGCKSATSPSQTSSDADFDRTFEALRGAHGLSALNVGLIRGGQLVEVGAYGTADRRSGSPARPDTIYALASVSKVFVGLAIARAIELGVGPDLDADINDYLRWSRPLAHPDFPDEPVTLRHLVRHKGGLVADGPGDYEDYPKPDPTGSLDGFLEGLLVDPAYWTDQAPGEAEEYSNLGTALAALVVEKAVGRPFEEFCNAEVFGPLGMNDTRWFYRELSQDQRGRLARPQGEDGPLEHYGFSDWPSGQLRSTVADLGRAIAMLVAKGQLEGRSILGRAAFDLFHGTPLFIGTDDGRFSHSGGESGVNTYIEYDAKGDGLIILTNQDLDDDVLEAMLDEVEAELRGWSSTGSTEQ